MANRASLDTNCLLRWLLQDLPEQAARIELILNNGSTYDVADAAIIEAVYVLETLYDLPRDIINNFLQTVLSLNQLNTNRNLFSQAGPLYVAHPALSFIDCCLTVYAELNDAAPLLTFDKKLAAQLPHAELVTR